MLVEVCPFSESCELYQYNTVKLASIYRRALVLIESMHLADPKLSLCKAEKYSFLKTISKSMLQIESKEFPTSEEKLLQLNSIIKLYQGHANGLRKEMDKISRELEKFLDYIEEKIEYLKNKGLFIGFEEQRSIKFIINNYISITERNQEAEKLFTDSIIAIEKIISDYNLIHKPENNI